LTTKQKENLMTHKPPIGVLLMVFFIISSISLWSHAQAAKDWHTMHDGANPPTVEGAREQCLRSGVSAAECAEFEEMLRARECSSTSVPDKTMYRFMNGTNGTQGLTRKMLGGDTPVLRCRLSGGLVLDWYHESVIGDAACNNVGAPILQSVSTPEPAAPQVEVVPKRSVQVTNHPPGVVYIPGVRVDLGCCNCSNNDIFLPGMQVVTPRGQSTSIRFE
jgi:hypothetical protein